jgi:hypothetical protein
VSHLSIVPLHLLRVPTSWHRALKKAVNGRHEAEHDGSIKLIPLLTMRGLLTH